MRGLSLSILTLAVVSLCANSTSAQTFTPLTLSEVGYISPTGVSADGNVVVGGGYVSGLGNVARRWRNGIGFDYPGPSSGPVANWASGVSASGSVISGGTGHAVFGDLEGWVRIGNSVGHVGSPSGHDTSDCRGVSVDGSVIVGYGGVQSNPNLFQAAWYAESSGWHNIGFLAGGDDSKALATNLNGSVIVGWSGDSTPAYKSAFRWTSAGGMQPIPHLSGGNEATASAVSADGSVVVGDDYVVDATFQSTQTAWRWSASTGTQALGTLPGGTTSIASGISPDGSVVVGAADVGGTWHAFVWDAAHGMRDLRTLLAAQGLAGVLGAWDLDFANCIAGTGPWYLAGNGVGPGPYDAAWLVRLDSLDTPPADGPFCFGDGTGTACPCSNESPLGSFAGCLNSTGVGGALDAAGAASVASDSLVLYGFDMPSSSALYFQGSAQAGAGAGTVFGDGLRCASGAVVRLGTTQNVSGASQYPDAGDLSISVRGGASAGETHTYQVWYRNAASFCTASTFNLTNGYRVTWTP